MVFVFLTIAGLFVIAAIAVPVYGAWVFIDNVRARLDNARVIRAHARAIRDATTVRHEKA